MFFALVDVPSRLMTWELCLVAVGLDAAVLGHVRMKLKSRDFCLAAVRLDGRALEHASTELRTAGSCLETVRRKGWSIRYALEGSASVEICLAAVKRIWPCAHLFRPASSAWKAAWSLLENEAMPFGMPRTV